MVTLSDQYLREIYVWLMALSPESTLRSNRNILTSACKELSI